MLSEYWSHSIEQWGNGPTCNAQSLLSFCLACRERRLWHKSVTEWARNLAKGAGSQGRILSTMYWPACLSSCLSQTVSLKLSLCLALVSIIDGAIEVLSKKNYSAHFNWLKMLRPLCLKLHLLAMSLLVQHPNKHVRWYIKHLKWLMCTKY